LEYRSSLKAALNIGPKEQTNSTVRVCIGRVPPQKFSDNQLANIDQIKVDGTEVWSRPKKQLTFQDQQEDEGERFEEMAQRYGLLDSNGIPG
jgi:hypothetical protein